jgi:hypothetical protein
VASPKGAVGYQVEAVRAGQQGTCQRSGQNSPGGHHHIASVEKTIRRLHRAGGTEEINIMEVRAGWSAIQSWGNSARW